MMMLKSVATAITLAATAIATPAQACWTREGVSAARIAEFNAAMMVTTMRCSLIAVDIKASYEAFVVQYKKRLNKADDLLEQHFRDKGGVGKYRHFYTLIGNRYGAMPTDGGRCALFSAVAADLAKSGSSDEALDKYALALIPNPGIDGTQCPEIAAKP